MTPRLLRVDMHLHTHRSFDCLSRPAALLEAAAARGIDRLIVTDHNEISGAIELQSIDPERVIVGEEVKTREGFDVIGIFVSELIPKGTPARLTCELILEQGGIVYLPHPFDGLRGPNRAALDSLLDVIDVIEVHNARCWPARLNAKAGEWAREAGKLAGAGSDAHTVREVGRGFVEVPPFEPGRDSFLDALRQGRVGGRFNTSPVFRIASTWAKVRKRLPLAS
jgi:predicted metal-dependent phosphoesterase TrpH